MSLRTFLFGTAAALVAGFGTASAQPAVSQYGFFADGSLGYSKAGFRDGFGAFFGGSFAGPLPTLSKMGFQIDAGVGTLDGKTYGGGGAWLFWRDPNQAMIGFGGMASSYVNTTASRLAVRGEYFIDRLTLGGSVGYQLSDQDGCCAVRAPGGGVFTAKADYYLTPDFKAYGMGGYLADHGVGRLGVEYKPNFAPQWNGLTTFADGGISQGAGYLQIGARFNFGASGKPLIREDREDRIETEFRTLTLGLRHAF